MRILLLSVLIISAAYAQDDTEDDFQDNPLGVHPIKLHTVNGLIIPAIIVGVIALTTEADNEEKKRLELFDDMGYSKGYKYPNTNLIQNNIGVNYFFRSHVSVGAEFITLKAWDEFNDAIGFGVRPFARFYAVNNENYNIYFESGAGLVYTNEEFPTPSNQDGRMGTKINGMTKYGIGGGFSIDKELFINVGIRHVHMSNGNVMGEERNPSHDSNGAFLGLSYKW